MSGAKRQPLSKGLEKKAVPLPPHFWPRPMFSVSTSRTGASAIHQMPRPIPTYFVNAGVAHASISMRKIPEPVKDVVMTVEHLPSVETKSFQIVMQAEILPTVETKSFQVVEKVQTVEKFSRIAQTFGVKNKWSTVTTDHYVQTTDNRRVNKNAVK